MKLISMTSFVLEQRMTSEEVNAASFQQIQNHINTYYDKVYAYAQFLKQPLTLGMFVPVDKHGNITEPLKGCCSGADCGCMGMPINVSSREEMEDVLEAENRVLFKGFEYVGVWGGFSELKHLSGKMIYIRKDGTGITEKQLLAQPFEIELTDSALKQIGINP